MMDNSKSSERILARTLARELTDEELGTIAGAFSTLLSTYYGLNGDYATVQDPN